MFDQHWSMDFEHTCQQPKVTLTAQNQTLWVTTVAMLGDANDNRYSTFQAKKGQQGIDYMYTKAKHMKDHPLHKGTEEQGEGRLKRTHFLRNEKALQ